MCINQGSTSGTENPDGSFEESRLNDDLNSLLTEVKAKNQLDDSFSPGYSQGEGAQSSSQVKSHDITKKSRHWQYCYHFPLPSDEQSVHDCNQRYVLLYGAGKGKDEASKAVKKLSKEILKVVNNISL